MKPTEKHPAVRVRYAPSPTGFLHIGNFRTALYQFLWARKNNGTFILRIEDTDAKRTVPGSLENILKTLKDFGLDFDEGPIFQSGRLDIYKKYAQELVDNGHAYYCFCTPERLEELRNTQQENKQPPKYDKYCLKLSEEDMSAKLQAGEPRVIRLNVPADQVIKSMDVIHGEISVSSNDIDDQVLMKSDGFPTYHLAATIDDHLMNISHVIRGDEWLPSLPKHILLYSFFGWPPPQFVHLPLLLSKSRKKLSKRDGDAAVKDFLEKGYLPEALLNFVALLGWNPKNDQEIFSLQELIEGFSLEKLNKSGAVFDLDKLDWLNREYIKKLDDGAIVTYIKPMFTDTTATEEQLQKIVAVQRDRAKTLKDFRTESGFLFELSEYEPGLLVWKKDSLERTREMFTKLISAIQGISAENRDSLEKGLEPIVAEYGRGSVYWPLRVALSGLSASPDPIAIADVLGKDEVLRRVRAAAAKLGI